MVKRYSASPMGVVEDPNGPLVKWIEHTEAVAEAYDRGECDGYREGVQDAQGG